MSLPELQDLLDQWLIIWQARPHDGLRDPLHPGRGFNPNEKYAALTETAGDVPLALSPRDDIELLPATWRAANAYGIKISRRVYDGKELNLLRMQHSGVTARKGLDEVHHTLTTSRGSGSASTATADGSPCSGPSCTGSRPRSGNWPETMLAS